MQGNYVCTSDKTKESNKSIPNGDDNDDDDDDGDDDDDDDDGGDDDDDDYYYNDDDHDHDDDDDDDDHDDDDDNDDDDTLLYHLFEVVFKGALQWLKYIKIDYKTWYIVTKLSLSLVFSGHWFDNLGAAFEKAQSL